MSRFDSMIAKGINTFDADATAADIALGKTAYVANQKIIGEAIPGGGGDYSIVGRTIDVEARTTITKGDRIVGEANNEYVTPTLAFSNISVPITSLSKDNEVALNWASGTPTLISIYFRNQAGNFDSSDSIALTVDISLTKSPVLSQDGTLAIYSKGSDIIIIEIDKEAKTATYYHPNSFSYDYDDGNATYVWRITNPECSMTAHGLIFEKDGTKYICCEAKCNSVARSDSTLGTNKYWVCLFEYMGNGEIAFYRVLQRDIQSDDIKGAWWNGTDLFFEPTTYNQVAKIFRYDFASETSTQILSSSGSSIASMSSNCKYIALSYHTNYSYSGDTTNAAIYKVNSDYTTTRLAYVIVNSSRYGTTYRCYVSDDGQYLLYCDEGSGSDAYRKILKLENGALSVMYSNTNLRNGAYNDVFNIIQTYMANNKIISAVPGAEAEYLISATISEDCSTADRIYGVASQDLVVGERGEARGIFNTFT